MHYAANPYSLTWLLIGRTLNWITRRYDLPFPELSDRKSVLLGYLFIPVYTFFTIFCLCD